MCTSAGPRPMSRLRSPGSATRARCSAGFRTMRLATRRPDICAAMGSMPRRFRPARGGWGSISSASARGFAPALGARSAELAIAAAEAAAASAIAISFDGNYRAQLWQRWDSNPREILSRLVGQAEIFFGNHRDISLLLGQEFSGDGEPRRRASAEAVFEAFPKLKLIASTARHMDDADRHRISARIDTREGSAQTEEVTVAGIVDRIGAGDAFDAGVLHGVRLGRGLDWTVRAGLALSCLKHSLPGDAALFATKDIEAFMAGELD